MDYINLGSTIRKKRIEKNLTQENLAELARISAPYVGQIERGEKHISLENFINIANALNCSTDELLRKSTTNNIDSRINEIIIGIKNCNDKDIEKVIEIIKILSK